ncbi:MAG: hypothetical protein WA051_01255 [Minisyncoccia bacterium]
MTKMVFIAHPMSGDIRGNTRRVEEICRSVHTLDVIPVFPSFVWRRYLKEVKKCGYQSSLASRVNDEYFKRKFIDEVWLYGDRITNGMLAEILLAWKYHIPVIGKTPETIRMLKQYEREYGRT